MNAPSYGIQMRRDFGVIAKCPHCEKRNITKVVPTQVTCGSAQCQKARQLVTNQLQAARRRAKKGGAVE